MERTATPGLSSVAIGTAPNEFRALIFNVEGTEWLVFEYVTAGDEPSRIEAFWRSAISTAAFRRATDSAGLPGVLGWTLRLKTVGGEILQEESFTIRAHAFGREPSHDAAALEKRVLSSKGEGVSSVSVEVLNPDGAAPIITLETADPGEFLQSDALGTVVGDLSAYEGYLIRVLDSNGDVVWIQGCSLRTGQTMTWTRPDLRTPV